MVTGILLQASCQGISNLWGEAMTIKQDNFEFAFDYAAFGRRLRIVRHALGFTELRCNAV
jgi:hypothetical protein